MSRHKPGDFTPPADPSSTSQDGDARYDLDLPPEPPEPSLRSVEHERPPAEPRPPEEASAAVPAADSPPEPQEPSIGGALDALLAAPRKAPEEADNTRPRGVGTELQLGAHGSYKLLKPLGRGGMAEVFLAKHSGHAGFERDIALKRILPGVAADPTYRQMFLEEARLIARLNHPNIAQVLALSEHEGGLYLAMEYIEGHSLRELLRACQSKALLFSEGMACYVTAALADALHYAHQAKDAAGRILNLVHRDVSPHNVMLSVDGAVKLLDFGIAKADTATAEKTATGMFKGKVAYCSPEQAAGDVKLDGRSDLFCLGIVFAEMLTGRRVFEAPTDTKTLMRVCAADPADVESATRELPPGLQQILLRVLRKERDERYANGAELAKAIRQYMMSRELLFGPAEAVDELERIHGAAAPVAGDGTSAARPRAKSVSKPPPPIATGERAREGSLSESGAAMPLAGVGSVSEQLPRGPSATQVKRLEAVRAEIQNPRGASAKTLLGPAIAVGGSALIILGLVTVVFRTDPTASPRSTEVVKTATQLEAESLAQQRADIDVPAPRPAAVPAAAPHLAQETAPRAPTTRRRQVLPAAAPPATAEPVRPTYRRSLDSNMVASTAGSTRSAGAVPRGTLIPAKLQSVADADHPGPVLAESTVDVRIGAATVLPARTKFVCESSGGSPGRVAVRCDTALIPGRGEVKVKLVAMGTDARPGLQVAGTAVVSADPTVEGAKDAAVASARDLCAGVAGALCDRVLGVARQASSGSAQPSGSNAARVGRTFKLFVQEGF